MRLGPARMGARLLALLLLGPTSASAEAGRPAPLDAVEEAVAREARDILEALVGVDTSAGNEAAALRPIAERFRSAGAAVEIIESAPGRGNLIARVRGTGKKRPLLLLAHADVVPVTGQPWTTPPFELTERGPYLCGRGVNDDKGMAAANVAIALEVARSKSPLARDLIVAVTAGEETGGIAGVKWLVEHHPDLLDAELGLNEGGGGLQLAPDEGRVEEIDVGVAEKIFQSFRLVVKGRGGHSSEPPTEHDPVTSLARALVRVGEHRFPARVVPAARAGIAARALTEKPPLADALRRVAETGSVSPADEEILHRDATANASVRTTCVATMLRGSPQDNVLPTSAEATVNCRIMPDETPDAAREALVRAIADPSVEVVPSSGFPGGPAAPVEGPVMDAIRRVSQEVWGEVTVVPILGFGTNDSRYLRKRGVLMYGVHPNPLTVEEDQKGHSAHGADERVPTRWYPQGVRWLRRLVLELAR